MIDDLFLPPIPEEEVEIVPILSEDVDEGDLDLPDGEQTKELPVLPLRNTILFPGVVLPITVGRDKSIKAVEQAYHSDKIIAVVGQPNGAIEDPHAKDIFNVCTIARVIKLLKLPDGTNTVIIHGKRRARIEDITSEDPYLLASISPKPSDELPKNKEFEAIISSLKDLAKEIIKLSPNIPSDASNALKNINNPLFLVHFIASNLNSDSGEKQRILEIDDVQERANTVLESLNKELQLLELKSQIQSKVRGDIEKQQRDYFLHQEMKKIQEELGGDALDKEVRRLREKAAKVKLSKAAKELFNRDLEKLERTNPAAAEYSVILNYLDLLLDLPWGVYSKDVFDLVKARKTLDRDHYGLDKVKERILEYLAVLKLKGDLKSPILCLVGPPGVGKTSLGKSIGAALNRNYVRMSLGGLHDESEIRGHRKTYIGAMPGRIIQSLKKVKTSNPVFILDEIDKVGKDFRGDPSSALLEVLDPEQNNAFYDNYLELEYDLSKVMFIATANTLSTIHPALRDRMEIIRIDGYSLEEKREIAKKHLVPKQRKAHGLTASDIKIGVKSLDVLVENYTRESGVRELDRTLASLMRNRAKKVAGEEKFETSVSIEDIESILGPNRYDQGLYQEQNPPGVAIGLAYTQTGGDVLFIEVSLHPGKGKIHLTGNLGDVMKESATTALTYIKAHAEELGCDHVLESDRDIHLHVPEGAIPKDGPSAGITILTAITSALRGVKVKRNLAMTGEITLRGRVLPVGGIKEKVLAAKRSGMKEIIVCEQNKKDVQQIETNYVKNLKFHFVKHMDEVLDIALRK